MSILNNQIVNDFIEKVSVYLFFSLSILIFLSFFRYAGFIKSIKYKFLTEKQKQQVDKFCLNNKWTLSKFERQSCFLYAPVTGKIQSVYQGFYEKIILFLSLASLGFDLKYLLKFSSPPFWLISLFLFSSMIISIYSLILECNQKEILKAFNNVETSYSVTLELYGFWMLWCMFPNFLFFGIDFGISPYIFIMVMNVFFIGAFYVITMAIIRYDYFKIPKIQSLRKILDLEGIVIIVGIGISLQVPQYQLHHNWSVEDLLAAPLSLNSSNS